MSNFQELGHSVDHDYEPGSPHLKHDSLRFDVTSSLTRVVSDLLAINGTCRVLEVGAGHGVFTDSLVKAGADVVVTEMSAPSATHLRDKYSGSKQVKIVHDPTGDWLTQSDEMFDAVVCISVLHHIPDYLEFLTRAFQHINVGGAFISWQDPLWYPRRSRVNLAADKAAYFAWRVTQGEVKRGLRTRWRRLRNQIDEDNPSDMIEYHVVRKGVDEAAILDLGSNFFESIYLNTYWSTQAGFLHYLGSRTSFRTTFGLIFTNRLGPA